MKLGISDMPTLLRDVKGEPFCSFTGQCQRGDMVISASVGRTHGPCGCRYAIDRESSVLVHGEKCRYYGITLERVSPHSS